MKIDERNDEWLPFRRAQVGEIVDAIAPQGVSGPYLEIATYPEPKLFENRFSEAFEKGARNRMAFEWIEGKGWLRKS